MIFCKETRAVLQKIFRHYGCNNNSFTAQTYVHCVRHSGPWHTANDVSIIRFCDQWSAMAVRATPAWSHASTLINGVKLPVVVDLLLHGLKRRNPSDLNPGWVSRNVRWRTVLLVQRSLVVPSSVLHFHWDKIGSIPLALCSLFMPKITKFYRWILLLQAKIKVGPFNLAHPVESKSENQTRLLFIKTVLSQVMTLDDL